MSSGILFSVGQGPLVDQGHLIFEASRSNTGTPHSVGLPWTSDKPDAKKSQPTDIHAVGGTFFCFYVLFIYAYCTVAHSFNRHDVREFD